MEIAQQLKLTFTGVDICNIAFTSTQPLPQNSNVNFTVLPKVFYPSNEPKQFKIVMNVALSCPNYFDLKIDAIGYFIIDLELPDEQKKQFVNINAPAIMFPYIRSFIATLTANLGASTNLILIPPQFFKGDLPEIKEEDLPPVQVV